MSDVMFYETFAEEREALRRYLPARVKAAFTPSTIQALGVQRPPARVIATRTQSIVPLRWASQLSGVLTRSAGYDHLKTFRARGRPLVSCGYLPSYCARAAAEQAILLVLALLRRLKSQLRQWRRFDRDHLTGSECLGRRLLVVGVGRIGTEVVRIGQGLGMRVQGVDLVPRLSDTPYVSLNEGVREAEVIVCCLPLTTQTHGLLTYRLLRQARPGAVLVNIARGEIAPLRDLARLLEAGILSGLGLDVYEDEQVLADALRAGRRLPPGGILARALQTRDDVLLTPHNAFNTREALERKTRQSCEAVVSFLERGVFPDMIPDDRSGSSPRPPGCLRHRRAARRE